MKYGRVRDGSGVVQPVRLGQTGTLYVTNGSLDSPADIGPTLALDQVEILAPVVPGKIVCIGRNYRAHARELGHDVPAEPLIFLKPPSALQHPGGVIVLPPQSARVEHEGELAVVIGKSLRNANPSQARAAIAGYTCANDVTARDLQKRDVQFTRAKGFDTFCPLGPWLVTTRPDESATVTVRVNGIQRQHGHLREMIFGIEDILVFISSVMTLEPGDVVLTGTPEGVAPLLPGDQVEVMVDGIGTLSNAVVAA